MHTYIDCKRCAHWTMETRYKEHCGICHNTGKAIEPKEILCNLCGECMFSPIALDSVGYETPYGLFDAKVYAGYNSFHLFDLNKYTFSFCEACLRGLFIKCKIKPDIRDVGFDGENDMKIEWDKDQTDYEYRMWVDSGGKHDAYVNGLCNSIKDCPNKALYSNLNYHDEFSEDCSCEEHKDEMYGKVVPFICDMLKAFL